MGNLQFYDAAFPPANPPAGMDGVQFYIGGDTPHVWTLEEIQAARVRFRLPTWVRSNPSVQIAQQDAQDAVKQLVAIGAPVHTLVCLDSETSVDPEYVALFFYAMRGFGYQIIEYGSVSTVFSNVIPNGLYDGAHWTNRAHMEPGTQMTQWEAFGAFDESSALSTLPFWDTQAAPTSEFARLTALHMGDTGLAVRRLQGLLVADFHDIAIDGIFGPMTMGAVTAVQQSMKVPQTGIVSVPVWLNLLGIG